MSSCVASSCICFQTASCASGISASWPTDGVPRSCLFAFSCSAQHCGQSNTRHAPRTPVIFGSAPSALDPWWSSRDSRPPKYSFVLLSTPGHCRRMKQLFPSRKLCVLWHGPLLFALSPNKSLFPASTCIGSASAANPRGSLQVALPGSAPQHLTPVTYFAKRASVKALRLIGT